jgi:uroporphyrinogen decarboxylase
MCRGDLAAYARGSPAALHRALGVIARSTGQFAARAVELGCAGVYFAMQSATASAFSEVEYREFGLPYDLAALSPTLGKSWFNVAHIHGADIMFDLVKDYPVQAISWHVWETPPSPAEFLRLAPGKTIVGGLQRRDITAGNKTELRRQIADMMASTGGRRLVLAPGCVIRAPFDQDCLDFVRREIDGYTLDPALQ